MTVVVGLTLTGVWVLLLGSLILGFVWQVGSAVI